MAYPRFFIFASQNPHKDHGTHVAGRTTPPTQSVLSSCVSGGPNVYPWSHSGTQTSVCGIVPAAAKLSQLPAPVPLPPFTGFSYAHNPSLLQTYPTVRARRRTRRYTRQPIFHDYNPHSEKAMSDTINTRRVEFRTRPGEAKFRRGARSGSRLLR